MSLAHIPYRVCGIYEIVDTQTGRRYVGQSRNVKQRLHNHKSSLERGEHSNPWLQRVWSERSDQFRFDLLEECPAEILTEREQFWIDSSEKCFNVARKATPGPKSARNVWTEERRQKQSVAMKGNAHMKGKVGRSHPCSEENRKFHSERMKKLWSEGKMKHSPEHRAKLTAALIERNRARKKKPISQELREAL